MEVIDKLEIRVPALTPFSKELEPLERAIRSCATVPGFRPSMLYACVGDLRQFEIPAIVHLNCKRSSQPNHKLELLDTGSMSLEQMLATVEQVFRFNPLSGGVMRVDLAADVPGIPVSFFEHAFYAQFKRSDCDIGRLDRCRMGGAEIETVYSGKRPNCIRIYNKTAEFLQQYRRLKRRQRSTEPLAPFEELFGLREDTVLTRVERQIGGGRVPPELATLELLRQNAASFNPFERLRLAPIAAGLPTVEEAGLSAWLQGIGLRVLAGRIGIHRLRRFLNQYSDRNGARILAQFAPFLPMRGDATITPEGLTGIYRTSVGRQIGGSGELGVSYYPPGGRFGDSLLTRT